MARLRAQLLQLHLLSLLLDRLRLSPLGREKTLLLGCLSLRLLLLGLDLRNNLLVRMNRLTGSTERFSGYRWEAVEEEKKIEALPSTEQDKVTGNGGLNSNGTFFEEKLYNGSSWTIRKLTIRIEAKDKSGVVKWDRKFEDSTHIAPLAAGSFEFEVLHSDEGVTSADWTISDIQGYRSDE